MGHRLGYGPKLCTDMNETSQDIDSRPDFLLDWENAAAAAAAALRCTSPGTLRYRQALSVRHLAVVRDLQALHADNLRKADVPNLVIAGQSETIAEARRASLGADDARYGPVGVSREDDGAEETALVGRGGVGVGGGGEAVEAEDVHLGGAGAGDGRAGGEGGVELAAVGVGGDVVEAHQHVAVEEGAVVGGQAHCDVHVVGRGRRVLFVDVVDEGWEDGAATAGDQVGGAGWLGGGEEGGGQDGGGDGEGVHFGCLVLFWWRF